MPETDIDALTRATVPDDWTDLDRRAVDTVRVLAMDAVQKVGNGHPGTAMSLAPAAYLLFQQRHAARPDRPATGSAATGSCCPCGHSSLTLYIQLYLSGYGLELDDLKALRTWGSLTPGHPEHGHTAGVEITTGPLGPGPGHRGRHGDGRAPRARPARPGRRRRARAPSTTPIYVIASDGDIEEGVTGEASSLAGHQQLGNLVVIYDDNQISIEDDTDDRLQRGHRASATRPTAGTSRPSTGPRTATADVHRGRRRRCTTRSAPPRPSRPPVVHRRCARSSPGRRRTRRTPARPTARRSARTEVARDQGGPRLRPRTRPSRSTTTCSPTPARSSTAAQQAHAEWDERVRARGAPANPERAALLDRLLDRELPDGWTTALPVVRGRREGRRHPQGLRRGAQRARPDVLPELWGGSADLAESQQHHDGGRALVPARRAARPRCGRATRTAACCTSASASTPWARS